MRYFAETPKWATAKFGMKKAETLNYFPLTDSMAPSSAILELLASELPVFRLSPHDLRVGWTDLYQIWWKR